MNRNRVLLLLRYLRFGYLFTVITLVHRSHWAMGSRPATSLGVCLERKLDSVERK